MGNDHPWVDLDIRRSESETDVESFVFSLEDDITDVELGGVANGKNKKKKFHNLNMTSSPSQMTVE